MIQLARVPMTPTAAAWAFQAVALAAITDHRNPNLRVEAKT